MVVLDAVVEEELRAGLAGLPPVSKILLVQYTIYRHIYDIALFGARRT